MADEEVVPARIEDKDHDTYTEEPKEMPHREQLFPGCR